jgi:hypothetical protein
MQTYLCGIQDAIFLPAILSATKEKPPEINDFRGFVVAGVVLLTASGGSRVPFWGRFTIRNLESLRSLSAFLLQGL